MGVPSFWDVFLDNIHTTLIPGSPSGAEAAAGILARAYALRLLDLVTLSDLSLLRLIVDSPWENSVRQAADSEFRKRQLDRDRPRLMQALSQETRVDLTTLEGLFHNGNSGQRGVSAEILLRKWAPPLARFLGRLYLTDPTEMRVWAVPAITRALPAWAKLPRGTLDFECALFRRVLDRRPGDPPPDLVPGPGGTPWLDALPPDEQTFLRACSLLSHDQRALIFLAFYAGLHVDQLALVLSEPGNTVPIEDVIADLALAWHRVLRAMPRMRVPLR